MTTTMYKTTTEPAEKGRRAFSQVLEKLREMVISYEIKPGERLNEVALAERLGVSRTPVREALHFLARDGFLAEAGRGYVRRPLNLKEMIDLYETREVLEVACLQLAAGRATPQRLDALEAFLAESRAKSPDLPVTELVSLDETFHHMLAEMSGNHELQRILHNVNERIRFIRWSTWNASAATRPRPNTPPSSPRCAPATSAPRSRTCAAISPSAPNRSRNASRRDWRASTSTTTKPRQAPEAGPFRPRTASAG